LLGGARLREILKMNGSKVRFSLSGSLSKGMSL